MPNELNVDEFTETVAQQIAKQLSFEPNVLAEHVANFLYKKFETSGLTKPIQQKTSFPKEEKAAPVEEPKAPALDPTAWTKSLSRYFPKSFL